MCSAIASLSKTQASIQGKSISTSGLSLSGVQESRERGKNAHSASSNQSQSMLSLGSVDDLGLDDDSNDVFTAEEKNVDLLTNESILSVGSNHSAGGRTKKNLVVDVATDPRPVSKPTG